MRNTRRKSNNFARPLREQPVICFANALHSEMSSFVNLRHLAKKLVGAYKSRTLGVKEVQELLVWVV